MKRILTYLLIAFAMGGAFIAIKNKNTANQASTEASPRQATVDMTKVSNHANSGVVVTYFSSNVRCASCLKLEKLSQETIHTRFAKELALKHVQFQVLNMDLPENQHFITDYALVSKTVVVAEYKDGKVQRWVNLQDVWLKLSNPTEFDAYLTHAIAAYLRDPQS